MRKVLSIVLVLLLLPCTALASAKNIGVFNYTSFGEKDYEANIEVHIRDYNGGSYKPLSGALVVYFTLKKAWNTPYNKDTDNSLEVNYNYCEVYTDKNGIAKINHIRVDKEIGLNTEGYLLIYPVPEERGVHDLRRVVLEGNKTNRQWITTWVKYDQIVDTYDSW